MFRRAAAPSLTCAVALLLAWQPAWLHAQSGTIGLNFTGVTLASGSSLNGGITYAPPDSDGAVGPNDVVQLINGAFAVYNKLTGAQEQLISGRQFWLNANVDPGTDLNGLGAFNERIVYDPTSGRWIAAGLSGQTTNNNVMIARSDTSNPLGPWQAVIFPGNTGGGGFVDYTRMGVDAHGVYIATNNFTSNSASADGTGESVFSLPKSSLLAATPTLTNLTRIDGADTSLIGASVQPIINFGAASSHAPLLGTDFNAPSTVLFRSDLVGTTGAGATLTNGATITVANYDNPPLAAQPVGTRTISTIDDRISGNVYQVGNIIYAAHATLVGNNAAIAWTKIDETTNLVIQEGILSSPNFDYFQPSIAANANGDIVIGFTRSGFGSGGRLSDYAVVGSTFGDVTTFGDPFLLKSSSTSNYTQSGGRWGDYTTTVVDPSNPNVFWTFQEYATSSSAWATQITQITVPEPQSLALAALALAAFSTAAWRHRRRTAARLR
jgi:hypothetical protein